MARAVKFKNDDYLSSKSVDIKSLFNGTHYDIERYLQATIGASSGTDFNNLWQQGFYSISTTMLNAPSNFNSEGGHLIVLSNTRTDMTSGYRIQILFGRSATTNTMWIRKMNNGTIGNWITLNGDTGWQNLTLNSGITATVARCRKVGSIVFIEIQGLTGYSSVPATLLNLPASFRPSNALRIIETSGNALTRCQINSNGNLTIEYTANSTYTWLDINCSYLVD